MSEQARLPSYEEFRHAGQLPYHTPEADRVFWTLNGPLHSSVWIMSHGSLKPYAQETDESNPTWHPISQCPLTEPKISTITVKVDNLDRWEDDWLEIHREHAPELEEPEAGEYRYGPLPDYDPERDEESLSEERPLHLLECCDTPRPRGKISTIVVKPSPGNEFVTIHDYLSTLHPFLLASREDILNIANMWDQGDRPAEAKLMVNHNSLRSLRISLEDEDSALWRSMTEGREEDPLSMLTGPQNTLQRCYILDDLDSDGLVLCFAGAVLRREASRARPVDRHTHRADNPP
ncbi:hypothetical protein GQX73_g4878 [Xylaria multiplex]|uniref:Uncharacterized protein n=1 Tax=Xylaria multiplex TaxID=323545 RepID=A0A7C8IQD8_9PEZI|nr:hypothetical protein GQX73_g4878 [Xylaria multiplex]